MVAPMVNTPHGTVRQRIDHHDSQPRERNQQDKEHRDHGHQSGERADFGARDFGQRAAPVADGGHQNREVLHAAGQHRADQQPEKAGSESELRGQRRAHQRTGAGDGREVVPEQHPLGRSHIVMAVFEGMRRSGAAVVQRQRLGRDKRAVVAITDSVDAERAEQNRKVFIESVNPSNRKPKRAGPIVRLHPYRL